MATAQVNRAPSWSLFSALLLALVASNTAALPPREGTIRTLRHQVDPHSSDPQLEPMDYELHIQPFIAEGYFTGFVKITFMAHVINNYFYVNALGLDVYDERIFDPALQATIPILERVPLPQGEIITYRTKFILPLDQPLQFTANFSGKLLDTDFGEDLGFYRSFYADEDSGVKRWYAETQFQATNARRAFPCFDEPRFRTSFIVIIGHPSTLNVFSNSPVESISEPDENGTVWSRFQKTPPMPTYLVAFAVNDFVSTKNSLSPVKIWARKEAIAGVYESLELIPLFMNFLEEWTGKRYLLNKLDHIASRGHHGAMENWGLIIYKERVLSEHPNATTLDTIDARLTLAHEMAHQWFGNLVTLESWDYVWLSEGFATFMQYLVVDSVKSEWNLLDLFPVREIPKAFKEDEIRTAKPITHSVETPKDILANFNTLSYSKGASLLRMLQHAMGTQSFNMGVQRYLDRMWVGNASPEDLSIALDFQAKIDHTLARGIVVDKVIKSWSTQAGYPVITATRNKTSNTVYFTQKRFYRERGKETSETWWVPISVTTKSSYAGNSTRPALWVAPREGALLYDVDDSPWILANRERTGYFRVNYDRENWEQLIKQLQTSPYELSETDIAMLIDDAAAFAFAELLEPDILVGLLSYLPMERRSQPWIAAANIFHEKFSPHFPNQLDENFEIYQKWLQELVGEVYKQYGLPQKPEESIPDRMLRISLIQLAKEANLSSFVVDTTKESSVGSDGEEACLCSKIRYGPSTTVVEIVSLILNCDPEDDLQRMKLIRALACVLKPDALRLILSYSVTESGFSEKEKQVLWNEALKNANGPEIALDILKSYHDEIVSRHGMKYIASRLVTLAQYLNTDYQYDTLKKYAALYTTIDIKEDTLRALNVVRKNMDWNEKDRPRWVAAMKSMILPSPPPPTTTPPSSGYRLPGDVIPSHYDLTIVPNLEDFTFKGEATLTATVEKTTNVIVLHSANLTITKVTVTLVETGEIVSAESVKIDTEKQFLFVPMRKALEPKTDVRISIFYNGLLADDSLGFYKSSYEEDNKIKWLAATQFEPTYARRAFPCMDEPGFKATFKLTVSRFSHQTALSNMPIESTSKPDSNNRVWDKFAQTPKMSTYLVAFVISEFKAIPISSGSIKITVWARPALTEAVVAEQLSDALLTNLSVIFGHQPVPKYDFVALPDFYFGAMENWGLITFREYLLVNAATAGTSVQLKIANIIAHELSHQWFGNLLTVKWWSNLWLQEGMASFISYIAVDDVQHTSTSKERLSIVEFATGLEADSSQISSPLNFDVATPAEIASRTDSITYSKGAIVWNMLKCLMGEEKFLEGLQVYIRKNIFRNVDPSDLALALSHVQNNFGDGLSADELISSWADQPGYPVVNVFTNYENKSVTISQGSKRLLHHSPIRELKEQKWIIPVFLSSSGSDGKLVTVLRPSDTAKVLPITMSGLLLINTKREVPIRVNYDVRKWLAISASLEVENNRRLLGPITRATLFDDALWLSRTNRLDYTLALNLIPGYQYEDSTPVWQAMRRSLRHLEAVLRNSPTGDEFSIFLADEIVGRQFSSLGWNHKPDNDNEERLKRSVLASWACSLKIDSCVTSALEDYKSWLSGKSVSRDTLPTSICQGLAKDSSGFVAVLSSLFGTRKEDQEMRATIIYGLGCTKDESLRNKYLKDVLTLNGFLPSDVAPALDSLITNGYLDDVIEQVSADFESITANFGVEVVESLITNIAEHIMSEEHYEKIKTVVWSNEISDKLRIALTVAYDNIKSRESVRETVKGWVSSYDSSKPPTTPPTSPPSQPPTTAPSPSPTKPPIPGLNYRLPGDIEPEHYQLTFDPNLEDFSFSGEVVLTANVLKETNLIVLHSVNLTLSKTTVSDLKTGKVLSVESVTADVQRQFILVAMRETLQPRENVKIVVSYEGHMTDDDLGFYKSSYEENGEIKWLAATQFEPTYARRAFPCLDEPGYKATFKITMSRLRHQTILSNMPVESTSTPDSKNYVWDIFAQTPKMSTYLLAFVISEFKAIPISSGPIKITVWTRPALTEAIVAEQVSDALLTNMTESFGQQQPVSKYDFVALPDFHYGAMENWGLITFREYLLVNDATAGTAVQLKIANIIAHELAHQWFGNLLTVKWWSNLWLQEGMATFISYIAVDHVQHSSTSKERLVIDDFATGLEADSTELSSALNANVATPEEIAARTDSITYKKGAIVWNMLQSVMNEGNFGKALEEYVSKNLYKNVEPSTLVSALASVQQDLGEGVHPSELISSWADQPGYPVVNVITNYEQKVLTISQEGKRFLYHAPLNQTVNEQKWVIPIFLSFPRSIDEVVTVLRPSDAEKIVPITTTHLLLVNAKRQVPIRVNYDVRKWLQISSYLEVEDLRELLSPITRAALFDDALWLSRSKRLDYTLALNLLTGYKFEDSTPVWQAVRRSLRNLEALLRNSPAGDEFSKYLADEIVGKPFSSLGWTHKPEDDNEERLKRSVVTSWACSLKIDDCVSQAIKDFKLWFSGKSVSRDTLPTSICQGLADDSSRFLGVLTRLFDTRKEDQEMRAAIIYGLGCNKDKDLRKKYIQDVLTLNGFLSSDVTPALDTLIRNGYLDNVFEEVSTNFDKIKTSIGAVGIESLITILAENTVTEQHYEKIKKIVNSSEVSDKLRVALMIADHNVKSRESVRAIVTSWMSSSKPANNSSLLSIYSLH